MPLNPTDATPTQKRIQEEELAKSFNTGSPYFDMFRCGYYGVEFDDCASKCKRNGIALRQKDIDAWKDGRYKRDMMFLGESSIVMKASSSVTSSGIHADDAKLIDFPMIPQSMLNGNKRRFFPCTSDNKPMQKWGYTHEYVPELYLQQDARALSPVGWVGQNMLMQPFVVIDIDGAGHGCEDKSVIEFGRRFENITMKMEDPSKPGSFHLYFSTDRLIPVRHWPWAKIDFMGNAVNAAVYLKNKVSNGIRPAELTEEIWNAIQEYQKMRKEDYHVS